MSSMTTYDAAYFGIKTLLLCPTLMSWPNEKLFKDLVNSGYAEYGQFDSTKIQSWVKNVVPCDEPFQSTNAKDWDSVVTWMLKSPYKRNSKGGC